MICVQNLPTVPQVRPPRSVARWVRELGLASALFIIMVEPPGAQQTWPAATLLAGAPTSSRQGEIGLLVGRSTVLTTGRPIQRVSLSTPDIADALVTSPREVLIHGKAPGTISLLVWSDTGQISSYDVIVRRDLVALEEHLSQLFPGDAITVAANGSDLIIAGTVSSKYVVEKAAAVAAGHVENAEHVVNLLRQQEGVASEQVMLRVRFAEVSRTALQELGASFFTDVLGAHDYVGRVTTQQFAAPDFDNEEGLVFSDFLNVLAFNTQEHVGVVVKALQTRGLFQSLAEPNLITQNGTEATFLAGGEYPYPVLQGVTGAVTIMFKEFGVRLSFTPTIVGPDLIQLKVAPEVSALDFSNAISIDGFRVPALSTRRTETEVELRDGQTFAVAGLLDNTVTETLSKIPGLGDIPILGLLFQSRAYQKNQTELVVMITPHIVRRDSTGVASRLPDLAAPFLEPLDETLPPPPPAEIGANPRGPAPPDRATAFPDAPQPSRHERIPATGTALAPTASGTAPADGRPPDPGDAPARVEDGEQDTETGQLDDDADAREAVRAAEEAARQQVARQREQGARTYQADRQRAREEATHGAMAETEQKRVAAEWTQATRARRAHERRAREEAKRVSELAERAAEAEQKRFEAERKQAAQARQDDEEHARAHAMADARRYEQEHELAERAREQHEQLARERDKRQDELDRIRDEYQRRLERAQLKVDEIDRERLVVPTERRLVMPMRGWPVSELDRR